MSLGLCSCLCVCVCVRVGVCDLDLAACCVLVFVLLGRAVPRLDFVIAFVFALVLVVVRICIRIRVRFCCSLSVAHFDRSGVRLPVKGVIGGALSALCSLRVCTVRCAKSCLSLDPFSPMAKVTQ